MKLTPTRRRVLQAVANGQVEYHQFSACMGSRYEDASQSGKNVTTTVLWLQKNGLVVRAGIGEGLGIAAGHVTMRVTDAAREILGG